jgi:Nucleotidyl transferase AbiEii toxin, Type IV TA system
MTKTSSLYLAQSSMLQKIGGVQFDRPILLCGGTALARAYLHHRVSYDLDFFIGGRFDVNHLIRMLKAHTIPLTNTGIEDGTGDFAPQLFGWIPLHGVDLKVSFIEDSYFDMFPTEQKIIGGIPVLVDSLSGLYHRKIRTITGNGNSDVPTDGRQTARDLFDLYALDALVEPIPSFIRSINAQGANVSEKALALGLSQMPWHALLEEFEQIETLEHPSVKWPDATELMGSIRDRMRIVATDLSPHGKKLKT